jgi:hypothetical protein
MVAGYTQALEVAGYRRQGCGDVSFGNKRA